MSDGGVEMGKDDAEPLEQIDGGFGGAIGGGFKKEKSSSIMGWTGLFRPSVKSGGGRMKVPGGGGGAIEGGGGTIISPSTRSGTDITDPLDQLPPLTGKEKRQRTTDKGTVPWYALQHITFQCLTCVPATSLYILLEYEELFENCKQDSNKLHRATVDKIWSFHSVSTVLPSQTTSLKRMVKN